MRTPVLVALLSVLGLVTYASLPGPPRPAPRDVTTTVSDRSAGPDVAPVVTAAPVVRTSLNVRPYAVEGATVDEVHRSMSAGAPTDKGTTYFGMTASEIDVRFRTVRDGDGCRLGDVEVDLALTMTLPEWKPDGGAGYTLRRDWTRFAAALRRHEDSHRTRAETGARAVASALESVRAATCTEADAEGQRRVDRVQDRTAAEQELYDDRTDHGRTEGAAWPLSR